MMPKIEYLCIHKLPAPQIRTPSYHFDNKNYVLLLGISETIIELKNSFLSELHFITSLSIILDYLCPSCHSFSFSSA